MSGNKKVKLPVSEKVMEASAPFRVFVTHLQTPSCFWVHKSEDACEQLTSLEKDLNKICPLYLKSNNQELKPCKGELVAVYHEKLQKWIRGIVINWTTKGTVFLVDYGYTIPKVSQAVRYPDRMPPLKPQSFQVFLHGIIPLKHSDKDGVTLVKNRDWMLPAASKVLCLMSQCSSFYFECFQKREDTLIGNLHLVFENQSKPMSLSSTLCEAEMAVVDPDYFNANIEQQVGAFTLHWKTILAQTSDRQKFQLGFESPKMGNLSLPSQNLGPKDQIDDVDCNQHDVEELLIELTGNFVNYGNAAYDKELDEEFSRIISGHCKDDEKPKDEALKQNYDFLQPLTKASYPEAKYAPYCRVSNVKNPSEALLSSTESGEEVKVEKTFRERLAQAGLLLMGNNITKPLRSIREAALHADIHQVLYSNGFHTITNLQKHMWPAILRGQNVVSVGGPLTGKTIGYLAPIASNMLDNSLYKDLDFSIGPLSVILCAEASKAVYLNTMLEKFVSNDQEYNQGRNLKIKIVLTYGGCAEMDKMQQMMNGCHVLITTPSCFLRILSFFKHATDLQRLCHLIFDSGDILFQRQKELVDRILAECKKVLDVERRKKRPMQIIVTCQRWNKYVEDFTRFVSVNPTVLISCGLEVLAFCKLEPKIHMLSTRTSRASRVFDLVKEYHGRERIVVVFNTEAEAMNIGILLEGKVKNLLMAYDSMDQFSLASVNERWLHNDFHVNRQPVLLVTDCVLQELEVRNAQILIHYSMPIMKDVFNERIGCILQTCLDPPIEMLKALRPEVHFLLDCNDGRQTPALVDLLIRQRLEVPADLKIKASEAIKAREEMKNDSTLCTNLRNFGYCFQESSCPFRHVVRSALDENPPSVPESGEVDLKVIKIHSATHFSARLEKHKSVDGVTTDLMTKEHILVPMEMKKHYSDQSNRKMLTDHVAVGTICAVEDKMNHYKRVRIEILTNDTSGKPFKAFIRSLDEGWTRFVRTYALYCLPQHLAKYPAQAIDIHLCRLKPRDLDPAWSPAVGNMVALWLEEQVKNEDKDFYLHGKIVLSIAGCLWLDPLECRQHLSTVGFPAIHFSFRSRFFQYSLADDNPDHLKNLYELCKNGGIELPNYEVKKHRQTPVRLIDETLQPDWAFLPNDELSVVNVITIVSPSSFFVQIIKFQDVLEDLVDDICTHQNNQSFKSWKKAPTDPGSFILAKFPDNQTWYRAMIENVEPDGSFSLLFVDYGDRAVVPFKDILPLPELFLSKLPFQAIECSLAGVQPSNTTGWTESAADMLQKLTQSDKEKQAMKALVTKVIGKVKSTVTGGWRYAVELYDAKNQNLVNQDLVKSKEAQFEVKNIGCEKVPESMWRSVQDAMDKCLPSTDLDESQWQDSDSENSYTEQVPYYKEEEKKPVNGPTEESQTASDAKQVDPYGFNEEDLEYDSESSDISVGDISSFIENIPSKEAKESLLSLFGCLKQEDAKAAQAKAKKEVGDTDLSCDNETCITSALSGPVLQAAVVKIPPLIKTAFEPTIAWSQSDTWIFMKINLPFVTHYDLHIFPRRTIFLCMSQECVYSFDKTLFGFITPELSHHAAKGLYVEVKLKKLSRLSWLRLEHDPFMQQASKSKIVHDMDAKHVGETADLSNDEEEFHVRGTSEWSRRYKAGTEAIPTDPLQTILHDISDDDSGHSADEARPGVELFDPFDPLA